MFERAMLTRDSNMDVRLKKIIKDVTKAYGIYRYKTKDNRFMHRARGHYFIPLACFETEDNEIQLMGNGGKQLVTVYKIYATYKEKHRSTYLYYTSTYMIYKIRNGHTVKEWESPVHVGYNKWIFFNYIRNLN